MPSHQLHDNATVAITTLGCLSVSAGAVMMDVNPFGVATAFMIGGLSGFILTPDLDQVNGCISQHRMRLLHPWIGWLWTWYWKPYAKEYKHRGSSHWPVIGTVTRLLYGLAWTWPVLLLPWPWLGSWVLALILVDTGHWALDKLDKTLGGRL